MRTEDDVRQQRTSRTKQALSAEQARAARQARAAAVTLAASLLVLTAALGYLDGTGLFAPENWVDAGMLPRFATSPAWATVTYLPILIAGGAVGIYGKVRAARPGVRARWVLGAAWSCVVAAAFGAKACYSVLLLAVAGPRGLHLLPTLAAALAECGLTSAKFAFFGFFAAGPAALAYLISGRRARPAEPAAPVLQLAEPSAGQLGSAIWVWKKACGDPQSSRADTVEGGINLYSCRTGNDLPSPAFQTTALAQAYPRSAPGRLTALSSAATGLDLDLAGDGTGVLDVWIPGTSKPTGDWTGLSGVAIAAQPGGGWRLTAHAAGAYSLKVH
jgi:hypothetical protein